MKDQIFDNADSFAMSFDEEWKNKLWGFRIKDNIVFEHLSQHPLVSNPVPRKMAEFRVFSLKNLDNIFFFLFK